MEGYYEPHPRLPLSRPLVLTSFVAADTRSVGRRLAALSGLPFIDLDRRVEHHAGMSVWELIWRRGEEAYRELESRQLIRALGERPCAVVALGDGALIENANRQAVLARGRLVVLDLDLPNCYWRIKARYPSQAQPWHPLSSRPLVDLEQLRPYYETRRTAFCEAHHTLSVRGLHPSVVAGSLFELLPRLAADGL